MLWDRVLTILGRLYRPRRRVTIELTPDEQIVLQYLLRFGEGGEEDLFQEVSTRRWIEGPHSVLTSLFNLQVKGFITPAGSDPQRGALYRPTDRCRKVRSLLPDQPTSSIAVYFSVDAPTGAPRSPNKARPRWPL